MKLIAGTIGFLSLGAVGAFALGSIRTIHKDVAIIGGGASGAYAAVRLKEDLGKDIVVVEKAGRLGGHVNPYQDPVTGDNFDLGVQVFLDSGPEGRAFFERLNISTIPGRNFARPTIYADFTTGRPVSYTPPDFVPHTLNALAKFLEVITPLESMYLPGYFNFPTNTRDIPADLLLPFGEFVRKHGIEAAMPNLYQSTGVGMGDLMGSTTLYVLAAYGAPMARAVSGLNATFVPASGRNIEVYEKVADRLGSDILYNSTVLLSTRSNGDVTLLVENGVTRQKTRIIAKKLLISVEPTPQNLLPFALDGEEWDVFGKLKYTNEYVALVSHPSLPAETSILNVPERAAPNDTTAVQNANVLVGFEYHGKASKGLWRVTIVGGQFFSERDAKSLLNAHFAKLMQRGVIPQNRQPLEIVDFVTHGAMHMHADVREVKRGYINRMSALQGKRNTWWTGGAWASAFQNILWAYDDVLLTKMYP